MELTGIDLARLMNGRDHSPIVYFLRLGDWVKIGTTTNLIYRVNALSVTIAEVSKVVPGGAEVEAEMHRTFARYRIYDNREWFRRSGALKRFLQVNGVPAAIVRQRTEIVSTVPRVVPPRPERPEVGVSLSEAVRNGVLTGLSLDAARKAVQRDPEFPKPVAKWLTAYLYDPASLAHWQRNRPRLMPSRVE